MFVSQRVTCFGQDQDVKTCCNDAHKIKLIRCVVGATRLPIGGLSTWCDAWSIQLSGPVAIQFGKNQPTTAARSMQRIIQPVQHGQITLCYFSSLRIFCNHHCHPNAVTVQTKIFRTRRRNTSRALLKPYRERCRILIQTIAKALIGNVNKGITPSQLQVGDRPPGRHVGLAPLDCDNSHATTANRRPILNASIMIWCRPSLWPHKIGITSGQPHMCCCHVKIAGLLIQIVPVLFSIFIVSNTCQIAPVRPVFARLQHVQPQPS